MTTNTITQLSDPQGFSPDPLTDLLRSGAQRLIQQAVEAELAALLEAHASDKTDDGRARLVRHGHLPEREIMTGIGAVPVQVPRVRDRGDGEEKIRFTSMIGLADGYRESTQSWRELLLDLQRRGLTHAPDLAIGDGALEFWHALREVFGATKEQRCWFHKTSNVLNAMPKSVQAKAKGHLHDIWQAETRVDAEAAFDFFVTTYGVKYDKAVGKLTKDRDVLLAFYDFPAEHWKHVRTTNPIESTFATVRHRTGKTKGCLSRKTGLAMAFKLMMSAQTKWRKLDGANRMPEIIEGIAFKDGIKQLNHAA